jgi:hypothetical protein
MPVTVTGEPVLPTVATAPLLLVQLPPLVPSLSVSVDPLHNTVPPRILLTVLTVTVVRTVQPVAVVYVITLVPDMTPVTVPSVPTVTFPLLALQVPPPVVSLSITEEPAHTAAGVPRIAEAGLTVTVITFVQPVAVII